MKDRPCIIVLAARNIADRGTMVRVVPVTHNPPDNGAAALEMPRAVKGHLGLDSNRSWIILDEVNEFTWPGFDLRPVSHSHESVAYGFLPPRLFDSLMSRLRAVWQLGEGKATPRD